MSKVAVVYFSNTGNTKEMAEALAKGAGTEAVEWTDFSADQVGQYDALAFGSPATGSEELDGDFQELWDACIPNIGDRPVALFGSHDWGDGEWMETWRQSAEDAGLTVRDTVVCNLEPTSDVLDRLVELGRALAE